MSCFSSHPQRRRRQRKRPQRRLLQRRPLPKPPLARLLPRCTCLKSVVFGLGIYFYATRYDYAGEQEGDLQFSTGDIINILDTSDPSGWWQGEVHGVTGVFPSNFVQMNP